VSSRRATFRVAIGLALSVILLEPVVCAFDPVRVQQKRLRAAAAECIHSLGGAVSALAHPERCRRCGHGRIQVSCATLDEPARESGTVGRTSPGSISFTLGADEVAFWSPCRCVRFVMDARFSGESDLLYTGGECDLCED
jgi:hypothetical protein